MSWALYDFANSVFTTLVVTFIYATYFTKGIALNEVEGTVYWSRAVSISVFVVAMVAPFLGALADSSGSRKKYLLISTAVCLVATSFLYFPQKGDVLAAMVIFIIANIISDKEITSKIYCRGFISMF